MDKKHQQVEELMAHAQQAHLGLNQDEVANLRAQVLEDGGNEGGYLEQSRSIPVRPTKVSKLGSLFFELALPNEFIMEVGTDGARPALGGKFFRWGREFLKFPASVQTVYFVSDNANKNYQGMRIDGYACWRVDPEKPELAARCLDFSDPEYPMGNTNRLLRTICTEAIRHIIANLAIEDALTKKDEIGRMLKEQLARVERTWGVLFDQVGIERVVILSKQVFEDLQQQTRDSLRLSAATSRMQTDQDIEKKQAQHKEETEKVRNQSERETRIFRAKTESEIHSVELAEKSRRGGEERKTAEAGRKADAETAERLAEVDAAAKGREAGRRAEAQVQQIAHEGRIAGARAAAELARLEEEHARQVKAIAGKAEEESLLQDHRLKAQREAAAVEDELERKRLERMRIEEDIRNAVAGPRVVASLVDKMPEIAKAQKIERYTVLAGGSQAPLAGAVGQILAVLREEGLGDLLKNGGGAKDAPPRQKG